MSERKKIKVGITGQSGFMGTHLFNYLGLKDDIIRIPFSDEYFNDVYKIDDFVRECDVIIHLAAMNRHGDPQVIYDINIKLVLDLISTCERTKSKPHIIFSSSTQESRDNLYGKSKKDGRELLEKWADENSSFFTCMIIPNVFGPFGKPFYNSVIGTFSFQLTHADEPKIEIDAELKLIFINELNEEFYKAIMNNLGFPDGQRIKRYYVPHSSEIQVSKILNILKRFKKDYFEFGIIPRINNRFELALFNTFCCYIPHEKFPFSLKENIDERGSFVEIIKTNISGQFSYSTTKPGITRGNHFHTRKIERFVVVKGKAKIELRRIGTKEVITYLLDGDKLAFVDMPIWYTHNITNVGEEEMITLFWINEFYDPKDPDTFYEEI